MLRPVSTSWTEYRGQGFWCRDGMLEVWLALLVDELDTQAPAGGTEQDRWLRVLRDQWYQQVTVIYRGLVGSSLDEHLTTEARRRVIVGVVRQLRDRTAAGETLPQPGSVARLVGGAVFERDGATAQILRVADSFLWLLDGSLAPRPDGGGPWRRVLSDARPASGGRAARRGVGG